LSVQQDQPSDPAHSRKAFIGNAIWNSLGAVSTIAAGLLLQPYIVRKLGPARYGIWALVFSTLDYLRLFDFGLRASVVNYAARLRARGDQESMNQLVSTACVFYGALAIAVVAVSLAVSPVFADWFKVPDEYRHDATLLVMIVGASVGLGLFASVFTGLLEAFQRFDLVNRPYIASMTVRMVGSVVLLYYGHGLISLGLLALLCAIGERSANVRGVFMAFPDLRIRFRHASTVTLRSLTGYSFSSFLISNAILISNQSPMVMIGYLVSATEAGFYSLPTRLIGYVGDIVARVGTVTASRVADMDERGKAAAMLEWIAVLNRYCYALFLPFVLFLLVWGPALIERMVGPSFAARSAVVLAPVAILTALTTAGMFNTVAAIIGQGRHRVYAYGLTVEIVVYFLALAWSIPRFGIAGAAFSGLIVLGFSRGLLPAWEFCRQNNASLLWFLRMIYLRPTLLALPVAAIGCILQQTVLSGSSLPQLVLAGGVMSALFGLGAFGFVLQPQHRRELVHLIHVRLLRQGTLPGSVNQ